MSLDGAALYDDVRRYDGFGSHRYGSQGAAQAFDWIEGELARAGLTVASQAISLGRQYDFESGTLETPGGTVAVVPHWWIPEAQASFSLNAPVIEAGPAAGAFVRVDLPFDQAAYLTANHRAALAGAFARNPAAVLLTIGHERGEIYTYNVDQRQEPWPVPVVLVAARDRPLLDDAQRSGQPVSVQVRGRYRRDVPGRNVVGRLDRGAGRAIVVSTPVTSWFTSTCERGPGIAGFLAMARIARDRLAGVDLVFVATAGHEIGHGGMAHFMRADAPVPDTTAAWAHFGASLACYDGGPRLIARSAAMDALIARHFREVAGTALVGRDAAIGELREVHEAGYPAFFGMAGLHRLFHTPADSATGTGPEILEPVVRAYAATLAEIAAA